MTEAPRDRNLLLNVLKSIVKAYRICTLPVILMIWRDSYFFFRNTLAFLAAVNAVTLANRHVAGDTKPPDI